MQDRPALAYGVQPGLRFACVLDGRGGCRDLDWPAVEAWTPADGALWVHLERDEPHAQAWVRERSRLDPANAEALLCHDSRPRVEEAEEALLIFLRGVNRADPTAPLDLVPVHLWCDAARIVSLRDRDHFLLALRDIREALVAGRGPRHVGELFVQIAEKVTQNLEPVLVELEDSADELDTRLLDHDTPQCRKLLSELRRQAIQLRRYLAPQREALFRLQVEEAPWLGKREKIRLREVTDKVLRYLESLDALRDRATILQEDLATQVAEAHAKASNRLTTIAAVLLPPSLVAGLLGANVEGIPWRDNPWAFGVLCVLVLILFPIEVWVLRRLKWL